MNWTQIEGKFDQIKGDIKTKWGKLTDDDMKSLAGKRDNLVGRIVERYGVMKDDAEKQVDEWNRANANNDTETDAELRRERKAS